MQEVGRQGKSMNDEWIIRGTKTRRHEDKNMDIKTDKQASRHTISFGQKTRHKHHVENETIRRRAGKRSKGV